MFLFIIISSLTSNPQNCIFWGIYITVQVPLRYNYSTDNETQIESKTFFYITLVPFCGKITQRYRRNQKNNVHLR